MIETTELKTQKAKPKLSSPDGEVPIQAALSYLLHPGVRPRSYTHKPPEGVPWENCDYLPKRVQIHDAKVASLQPSLEREGFELFVAPSNAKNFYDSSEVQKVYYPEAVEIALAATGGKEVYIFDHLVRRRDQSGSAMSFGRNGNSDVPSANGRIHNDYTEESGLRRLSRVLPNPKDREKVGRYSIINLWRSIKGPILDTPLALCDARSVVLRDLVVADVINSDRVGEVYFVTHSDCHRWSYFSHMARDEVVVFKQFDSQLSGTSRFTPHAAFDHPNSPVGAPPRESIELRCLVVY